MPYVQDAASGRELGVEITVAAMATMLQLLLWRFQGLLSSSGGGRPDPEETEALAAARSAFSTQLDAIAACTELVHALKHCVLVLTRS